MSFEERFKKLRKNSGEVVYTDTLTSFFYSLMRDHLPAGVVEKLVHEVVNEEEERLFTNGWLAKYAYNLSEQIKLAKNKNLEDTLSKMFDASDEDDQDSDLVPDRPSFNSAQEMEDELESIREELEEAAKREGGMDEIVEKVTASEMGPTVEDGLKIIEELEQKGLIDKGKLEEVKKDLAEVEKELEEDDGRTPDTEDA